jgi:hypothetical protein
MNHIFDKTVMEFVASLEGIYKEAVSYKFLASLLSRQLQKAVYYRKPNEHLCNVVYDVGQFVFEAILEIDCRQSGNGHHVAQKFEQFIRNANIIENYE